MTSTDAFHRNSLTIIWFCVKKRQIRANEAKRLTQQDYIKFSLFSGMSRFFLCPFNSCETE